MESSVVYCPIRNNTIATIPETKPPMPAITPIMVTALEIIPWVPMRLSKLIRLSDNQLIAVKARDKSNI